MISAQAATQKKQQAALTAAFAVLVLQEHDFILSLFFLMPGFLAGWFFARIFDGKCVLRPERLWRYLIGISKKKRFCVTYGDSGDR